MNARKTSGRKSPVCKRWIIHICIPLGDDIIKKIWAVKPYQLDYYFELLWNYSGEFLCSTCSLYIILLKGHFTVKEREVRIKVERFSKLGHLLGTRG